MSLSGTEQQRPAQWSRTGRNNLDRGAQVSFRPKLRITTARPCASIQRKSQAHGTCVCLSVSGISVYMQRAKCVYSRAAEQATREIRLRVARASGLGSSGQLIGLPVGGPRAPVYTATAHGTHQRCPSALRRHARAEAPFSRLHKRPAYLGVQGWGLDREDLPGRLAGAQPRHTFAGEVD